MRLAPFALCVALTWSMRALACGNSMEGASLLTHTFALDVLFWPAGAVFLHRIVLVNVWDPTAEGQLKPSGFRRFFFLLVGACLVLMLMAVSAFAPLLDVSAEDMARCSVHGSMLLMLLASPAVLFALQAVLFHGPIRRWLGRKTAIVLVGLVVSSIFLAVMMGIARDDKILPELCGPSWGVSFNQDTY